MSYFAGDLKSININHPVEGSVVLQCEASQDNTMDLGGVRTSEVRVTGNGTSIRALNNVPWVVSALIMWDMVTELDLQKIIRMAGSTLEGDYTFVNINGAIYGGKGSPVEDFVANVNKSNVPSKFSGGGELKKIA